MYYNSTLNASRSILACHHFFVKNSSFFMKVNAIICIIVLFSVNSINASTVSAQSVNEVRISAGFSPGTLEQAFARIERETEFRFAYRKGILAGIRSPSLSPQTRTVQQTLDALLAGTDLQYKQVDNSIIITKNTAINAEPVLQQTITGTVKDEKGIPLPGVSVKVKGGSVAVMTDGTGTFRIQASRTEVLVFSYIGYVSTERKVVDAAAVDVVLKAEVGTLDAVVVIGYGTTTRRNNTGSVTSISAKDIANQPVTDPLAALQGRVAGLDISAVTGYPGSGYSVHLRGQNSISSGNDPLYIVDGIPFISESLSQFSGANGSQSPLSSLNPSDIEQIDILKDADATAIYGSRGANGVILITTKKGRAGKPEVTANIYRGISSVNKKVDMLNTSQYLALRREAFKNDGVIPTETNAPDLLLWDQNLDQNWQEKLLGKSAPLTQAELSLRGGSEQTNFIISGTVRDEKTVLPGDLGYKRGAVNFSLNHKSLDNKFKVTSSVKYTADENNTLPTDLTGFFNLAPNYPIYDAAGNYYWLNNEQNPLAYLERTSLSKTNNLFINTALSYQIIPGLNAKVSAGINKMDFKQTQTFPKLSFAPATYSGSTANYGNNTLNSYIVEPQLDYTLKLGKGNLSALAGGTWQNSITEGQSIVGSGYASDEQLQNIQAATQITARSYNYTKYRYTSVFGRLTYNWDEKYILNGTFRRDGSSRFGPNKQFGNFGAVGAAWLFSNESFVKDKLSFLTFGKLRASYGTVGNDQIGNYQYLDSWSATSFPYAGVAGLAPSRFPNPDYSWEVNKKLEAGLDLGFLGDRLLVTANFYRNRSGNQLIGYTLSSQSGFDQYTANLPAVVQNKGFEFELSSVNIRRNDFTWSTSANLSIAKTKLLEYPDLENSSNATTYVIGQPLQIVKGYDYLGIDKQTGVPLFRDINGDGVVTDPADMVVIGNTTPKFYGGLNNSLSYKNFTLDFLFQFVKQEGPGLNYGYLSYSNGIMKNKDLSALDRWQQPGDEADIPGASTTAGKAIYNAYQNQYRLSSANWVDASFIRLKNVSIKYNFASMLKNWKLNNVTLYLQGQNLLTITPYKGFDPETKAYALPPLSIYTAGLQVSF